MTPAVPSFSRKSQNILLGFTRPKKGWLPRPAPIPLHSLGKAGLPTNMLPPEELGPRNGEARGEGAQRAAPAFRKRWVPPSARCGRTGHQSTTAGAGPARLGSGSGPSLLILILIPGMGATGRQKHTQNFYSGARLFLCKGKPHTRREMSKHVRSKIK